MIKDHVIQCVGWALAQQRRWQRALLGQGPTYILLLTLCTQAAHSDAISDSLQKKLNAIRTMSAHFSQVVKANKRELSRSSGEMALARPGRFRWQTQHPMEQLVVADGRRLWIYDVDLEQVTVKPQDHGLGGTAGLFLSGYNDSVTKDFNVTMAADGNKQTFDLHATSNKASFQRVKLKFVGDALSGIELYDQLGQHTDVHLQAIKTNPKLTASLFNFKPPKGTDVVNQ